MLLSKFQFQTENPALLLVDWQEAIEHFGELARSHPNAEAQSAAVLQYWREQQWPVVHIRHSSRSKNSPYHAGSAFFGFKPSLAPISGELVLTKRENCAFGRTELCNILQERGIEELVFAGVLLNHSVDATVRMATALGFKSYLLPECCPAQEIQSLAGQNFSAEQVHDVFLSNLSGEYCQLIRVNQSLV